MDSDLIFDSIEDSNNNVYSHERHQRDLPPSLEDSQSSHVDESQHWFSGTLHRIKRHLGSMFSSPEPKQKQKRRSRQSDQDFFDQDQEEYDEDPENVSAVSFASSLTMKPFCILFRTSLVSRIHLWGTEATSKRFFTVFPCVLCYYFRLADDEDLITSGEGSAVSPSPTQPPSGTQGKSSVHTSCVAFNSSLYLVFYRVTFTLSEPFEEDYNNRSSQKFKDVSSGITEAIDDLYQELPGTQSASLIKIE